MKVLKSITLLLMVFTLCSAFSFGKKGKKAQKQVYVMGVSFSFKDSVFYMTDIQQIPDVKLTKDKFLPNREDYSSQLRSYLEEKDGDRNHTCVTYFSTKKDDLHKKAAAFVKKHEGIYPTVIIGSDVFKFEKPEEYTEE